MAKKTIVRRNRYLDSVFLMLVARRMAAQPGIRDASALMATDANRLTLAALGYGDDGRDAAFATAGPSDLVVAVDGEDAAVDAILATADSYFAEGSGPGAGDDGGPQPRTIAEALAAQPACNVALISVPGEHAAREARAALSAGLHAFVFSSNVSVEDEQALKREARERGLVVMGPDCGTAYLGGAGIGFANAVRRGPIGIVAASGTGMQELACLVHRAGSGISSGIGTGSRDLGDAIGGITTMAGIDALEADPSTQVIVVLSKPAGVETTQALAERVSRCTKPVVACLLGADSGDGAALRSVPTIDDAARAALRAAASGEPAFLRADAQAMRERATVEVARMHPRQRYVRGLFAGGTFCYQAQAIFRAAGLEVSSNSPLPGMRELADPEVSCDHAFVDMGAETFVRGKPHPMIDATARRLRLAREGRDSAVAVILLDFVLGAIASPDPVGDLLDAVVAIQEGARTAGGHLTVVASVCGTEGDRQSLHAQTRALEDAGVVLFPSAAQAATFCREVALLLSRHRETT